MDLGQEIESCLGAMIEALEAHDIEVASRELGVDSCYKERGTEIDEESMVLQAHQADSFLYGIIQDKESFAEAFGLESVGAMSTYDVNDTYRVEEIEAIGSALIKAYEGGHDLGEWHPIEERMRLAGCRRCGRLLGLSGHLTRRPGALEAMP